METFYEIKPGLLKQSAIALGFFDGVHKGHQAVIQAAVNQARQLDIPAAVATFADHPRTLTTGKSPELLTSRQQRLEYLSDLGIDAVLALPFTEGICRMSPEEYVQKILIDCLGARSISVGYNHRFGRDRLGDTQVLTELGKQYGFSVQVTQGLFTDGSEISSSRIRQAIKSGDLSLAANLLGRRYTLTGKVLHGEKRGQSIGFPTANIELCPHQLLPNNGVYACLTRLRDGSKLPSVINLGVRPTVSTQNALSAEVHILNFDQDLYDSILSVEFWHFIRAEKKFDNIDALKAQIAADCQAAATLLSGVNPGTGPQAKLPA